MDQSRNPDPEHNLLPLHFMMFLVLISILLFYRERERVAHFIHLSKQQNEM